MTKNSQNIRNFLPWLIVAIIIVITAVFRFHLLAVPLERDEGHYAYAGQLMLDGVPPYIKVYTYFMPGMYAIYALIMTVFGQTHSGIHLGLLIINAATILLMFFLGKRLFGSLIGAAAAVAFALLSLGQHVQGIFANSEHFVIFFAIGGIVLVLRAADTQRYLSLLMGAVLLGASFLIKQHSAAFIVFMAVYLFFCEFRRRSFAWKPFVARGLVYLVGVLLPFTLTCLVLWRVGVFEKFWFWTVVYARECVSRIPILFGLENLKFAIIPIVRSAVLIWILAGIGLLTLFIEKKIRDRSLFIVGFLFFSFLATCPGFYFRPHYFILLLPAIALLSGVGLFGVQQVLRRLRKETIMKDLITVLLGLAILFYTLYQQKDFLLAKDPTVVSRMTYGFNPFPESLKIAEYIKTNSSSNDTIAIFGSEPQIYFYSDRRSASGYIFTYQLMEPHPYALQMQKEMIQQIETAKPKFLIFVNVSTSWLVMPTSKKLIFDWFNQYHQQYYRPVGIVDIVSRNQTIYRWNENAVGYTPRSKYWLAVFERKNGI